MLAARLARKEEREAEAWASGRKLRRHPRLGRRASAAVDHELHLVAANRFILVAVLRSRRRGECSVVALRSGRRWHWKLR